MPENNTSPEDTTDFTKSPIRKRPVRVKPAVEGINVSTNTVSVSSGAPRKQTIPEMDEGRIMTSSVASRATKKTHPVRTFFVWVILLAGLAFVGYWTYQLYWVQSSNTETVVEDENQNTYAPIPTVSTTTPSETSSSTPETITTLTTPTSTPSFMNPMIKIGQTETGYLNVRSEPATTGALVTKVNPGETYPYLSKKSGWYNIQLPDGKIGWVLGQYVTEVQ